MESSYPFSSNPVCHSASGSSRRSSSPCSPTAIAAEALPVVSHANLSALCSSNCPDASVPAVPTVPNTSSRRPFLKKTSPVELEILLNRISFPLIKDWYSVLSIDILHQRRKKSSFTRPLTLLFWSRYANYSTLSITSLRETAIPSTNRLSLPNTCAGLIFALLLTEFPEALLRVFINIRELNRNLSKRQSRLAAFEETVSHSSSSDQRIIESWPQPIPPDVALSYCKAYVNATNIRPPQPCVCCGRAFLSSQLTVAFIFSFDAKALPRDHPLNILNPENSVAPNLYPPLSAQSRILDHLLLHHKYVELDHSVHRLLLSLCGECNASIENKKIPKFSLCNNLYRGDLPSDLSDITWIKEKVCAIHRVMADVARIQNAERNETLPYKLVAYPVNVASTVSVLPRIPSDVNGNLTVVFFGAKFDCKKLPSMFRVRRRASGVASETPFELEHASLSGLVMDGDVAMGDSTKGTASTTVMKRKATAQHGAGNNKRGKGSKA